MRRNRSPAIAPLTPTASGSRHRPLANSAAAMSGHASRFGPLRRRTSSSARSGSNALPTRSSATHTPTPSSTTASAAASAESRRPNNRARAVELAHRSFHSTGFVASSGGRSGGATGSGRIRGGSAGRGGSGYAVFGGGPALWSRAQPRAARARITALTATCASGYAYPAASAQTVYGSRWMYRSRPNGVANTSGGTNAPHTSTAVRP